MAVSQTQLKAFHAVATHGNFTRAAEALYLSQPALSAQVRKLEERFGILLFHRNKRSVRLTDLGEQLLVITQRLFAAEEEAQELLSTSRALETGNLTLAVDSPVHLMGHIARFCERYPGVHVSLVTGNSDECLRRLQEYRADFALLGRTVEDDSLITHVLGSAPLVAFVAHSHPWAARESITLADLESMPMVLRERGSMTRRIFEDEMRRAGLSIRPAIEVEGREATFEMVAAGLGVGLVSAAEVGASTNVRVLPIRDCRQYMTETLVCLREQGARRVIEVFFELVRAQSEA